MYLWFAGGLIASGVLLLVSFGITGFLTGCYNLPVSVLTIGLGSHPVFLILSDLKPRGRSPRALIA